MGLSIAIIGFAIWPDLTRMQSLNYAIKTRPTVMVAPLGLELINLLNRHIHVATQCRCFMCTYLVCADESLHSVHCLNLGRLREHRRSFLWNNGRGLGIHHTAQEREREGEREKNLDKLLDKLLV